MDLHSYLQVARRRWRTIVATFLAVLAVTALVTLLTDKQYQASSEMYVSTVSAEDPTDLAQGSSFTQRQVATYADVVTTPLVLDPVIEELGLDTTPRTLAERISTQVPADTVLITINVTDEDPQQAQAIAESVTRHFVETLRGLDQVSEDTASPVKATIVSPAEVGSTPVSPQPLRNLALGAVLGLLLGFGAALLRDLLDTSIKGEADAKDVTDHTVIGGIAFDKGAAERPLLVQDDPHSTRAEAFRTLRTNLQFVDVANKPKVIVFTSSLPGEGKSTTTANLALTLAATGSRVCIVEGDLRRPRLLQYMGLESSVGLTNVLIGEADVDDVLQPFGNSLWVLGCGPIPPNPSELLGSPTMAELLRNLGHRFDYVIIDAPPLLPVTDAAVLSKVADGAIVVVGAGIIHKEHLQRALTSLHNVGAHVLGLVMNRLPTRGADAYYAYYGESYAPQRQPESRAEARRGRRSQEGHEENGESIADTLFR
ncbi:polysaccharide biosynthesis tyrosine autokinase [Ornithinicoccus halotolerans]|uniref:polysaccharide biosynthesis tyrosine autokinase n=1 Tax=Ornithinicoccus halotolerans TaxID=1748220 RepID=UPI00129815DC|nr:polysaccharide biosynthesis tyrosine autokinase [Ornithinicoccus halotolerans]